MKYYSDPNQLHSRYGVSWRGFVIGFASMNGLLDWRKSHSINTALQRVSVDEVYEEAMLYINLERDETT
ncbi:MAG: hypothetical protein LBG17_04775 [Bacteroidales bacterium]|jgi:hypothetical protein|nr:hypothetical protein [Bacteroidales bacterium]